MTENHPSKQFALPILFNMAHYSSCLPLLQAAGCVQFFIDLVADCAGGWQVRALQSLSIWLSISRDRCVEERLCHSDNIRALVATFCELKSSVSLEQFVTHLSNLLKSSAKLSRYMQVVVSFYVMCCLIHSPDAGCLVNQTIFFRKLYTFLEQKVSKRVVNLWFINVALCSFIT